MAQKGSMNRSTSQTATAGRAGSGKKKGSARENVIGIIIMAALGLLVYWETGLYDAAEAGVATVGFGAVIVGWFVYNFRNATIRHRKPQGR